MRSGLPISTKAILGLAVVLCGTAARAQQAAPTADNATTGWQSYDWLKPAEDQQRQAASGNAISVTTGQDIKDPTTVLTTGSLWQETYGVVYTRRMADTLSLSYETSAVVLSDDSEELSRGQKVGLQFQPVSTLTLGGNIHESEYDAPLFSNSTMTDGAGVSAEGHLPFNSVLTLGFNVDRTELQAPSGLLSQTNAYDAQFKQPLGKLPFTAVLKGHLDATTYASAPASSLPTLQQSVVWKAGETATVEMGLRQQQYQEYPGVSNQFNQAIFADWSQTVVGNVSWHSYAEVLNSKGLIDQAPAAPIASGANGTQQSTLPGSNAGLTSSLPVSLQDQTVTLSTGPSFLLQKDLSANVEYSNRWDRNPAAGSIGEEQRVSVSLKGTF